eukprot:c33542_g1_i1 orf=135-1136(+)
MGSFFAYPVLLLALILVFAGNAEHSQAQLLVHSYDTSCPRAESIVAETVKLAMSKDPNAPAKLIRLLFHDCFVQGCDGSILLDSTANSSAEKSATVSATLEGFDVIDQAKETLEQVCKATVSCADIVALAARDAVAAAGGPKFDMPTGRLDGLVSLASDANIPDPSSNLDQLLKAFGDKGLVLIDLVLLLGAHTVGVARCGAFSDRFTVHNGSMVADPTLDPAFAQSLEQACPAALPNAATTVPLDGTSSLLFDNAYYSNLQHGKGLLTADQVLFTDPRSKPLVQTFALDASSFFANFPPALVKLSTIGVKTAGSGTGEIRTHCRSRNSPSPP